MRYSGTWLTPDDEAVLESLQEGGPASPADLQVRLGTTFSRDYLADRCAMLAGRGGLVSFDHGAYRLSRQGEAYLEGDLDPQKLESE